MQCPACAQGRLEPFFEIASVPAHCNRLWPTREDARAAPRGAIRLGVCPDCGMLYNVAFEPALVEYTPDYENSLHFSPRFQAYAEDLAERLIREHGLAGRRIVEIGCGKGEFLAILCRGGRNQGLGFDASYDGSVDDAAAGHVRIVREHFSEASVREPADLVCCRHVLEHVPEPAGFLAGVRDAVRRAGLPRVFFEVPDGLWTLRDLGIWDVIYEHCSYFAKPALARLFARAGFAVERAYSTFGGQFLCVEAALATSGADAPPPAAEEIDEIRALARAFSAHYREKADAWQERLSGWLDAGRRVAIWGAGSKGVTFLNVVPAAAGIHAVVDLNPRKTGRHVPGTGHAIVSPESLRKDPVDVVLVMNPLYEDEIRRQLVELGAAAEVVAV